jgi:hypothetical protein
MSLKSLAAPQISPTTCNFPSGFCVKASNTGLARSTALGVPDVMTTSVPAAARVEPPETGESQIYHQPIGPLAPKGLLTPIFLPKASRRGRRVSRKEGGTVEKHRITAFSGSTTCQHLVRCTLKDDGHTRCYLPCTKQGILNLKSVDDH